MKEFLIGLIFLILVFVFAVLGMALFPLLIVLGIFFRAALYVLFAILAIWLLGKLIVMVWEALRSRPNH